MTTKWELDKHLENMLHYYNQWKETDDKKALGDAIWFAKILSIQLEGVWHSLVNVKE